MNTSVIIFFVITFQHASLCDESAETQTTESLLEALCCPLAWHVTYCSRPALHVEACRRCYHVLVLWKTAFIL